MHLFFPFLSHTFICAAQSWISGGHLLEDGSGAHLLGDGTGGHLLEDGSGGHLLGDNSRGHLVEDGSRGHRIERGSGGSRIFGKRPNLRCADCICVDGRNPGGVRNCAFIGHPPARDASQDGQYESGVRAGG